MKASTIEWHIKRDGNLALARFCEKNKVSSSSGAAHPQIGYDQWMYEITYKFDNGGFIEARLMAGDSTRGYSVADYFFVTDYDFGEEVGEKILITSAS